MSEQTKYPWCGSSPGISIVFLGWNSSPWLCHCLAICVSGLFTSLFSWASMSAFLSQKHHKRNLLDTNSYILSICLLQTSHGLFLSSLVLTLVPCFIHHINHLRSRHSPYFFHNLCPSHSFPVATWLLILWGGFFYHLDLLFEPFPHPVNSVTAFPWFPGASRNIALESSPSFSPLICTRG